MKFIKRALLSVFLVLMTLITALWAVVHFTQADTLRLIAKKQLSALTKQDSAINGSISWRVFPRPGLEVTKVRIGNVEQDTSDYALAADDILFHLQLSPLLRGKLVFDKLMIDGLTLNVNFDKSAPPDNHTEPTTAPAAKKATASAPSRVALKSLVLTNGKITLKQQKEVLLLKNVRLEANLPDALNEAFPIQLKATLKKQTGSFPLSGTLNYKGLLTLPRMPSTHIENLMLNGQLTLHNLHAGEYDITKAHAHAFFREGKLELNPLTFKVYNGESVGQLQYLLKNSELTFHQTGTGLNAEPVFQHILDITPSRLNGLLDFSIQARTQLNTPDFHKNMKATGNFTIHDGTLTSINLPAITKEATKTLRALATQNIEVIQQTLSQLKPWDVSNYSGSTPFKLLNLQYQTKGNGTMDYTVLLETKKLNLKGQGSLNLETKAINAHLVAHITSKDTTVQAVQLVLGHGFPLVVTGTLEHPFINADRPLIRRVMSTTEIPKQLIGPLKRFKNKMMKHDHLTTPSPTE